MGYAELLNKLQALPADKQAEVFDFVDFLTQRNSSAQTPGTTLADSELAQFIKSPILVTDFTPYSRDEANER